MRSETYDSSSSFGFEDPADFIERITYAIWNGPTRNPALIERYYSTESVIHTDQGDIVGPQLVIRNTEERLRMVPDFVGVIADTICAGDERQGYRTSMRWTWTGTTAADPLTGARGGRHVTVTTIANCVIRDGRIVEEWLASDSVDLNRQLGRPTPPAPTGVHLPPQTAVELSNDPSSTLVRKWLRHLLSGDPSGDRPLEAEFFVGRFRKSATEVSEWGLSWSRRSADLELRFEDQFAEQRVEVDGTVLDRIATRVRLTGSHLPPAGATLLAHHRVRGGRVVAAWIVYDSAMIG